MTETPNHRYNVPDAGTTDWHIPLNENWDRLDTDIEIRDIEGHLAEYVPRAGAKYLATDTENVFVGDGETWGRLTSTGVEPRFESLRTQRLNGVYYIDPATETYTDLQAALDELGDRPGTVVVGRGTLNVPDNVVVPSNTVLRGEGMFSSTLRLADDASLSLAGTVRIIGDNVVVSDLGIDGNKTNNEFTESHEHCLYTSGVADVLIARVHAHNAPGYGIDPHDEDDVVPTERITIRSCISHDNEYHGIALAGVQRGVVSGCYSSRNGKHGIDLTDELGHDITVSDCYSFENGGNGLVVHNGTETVRVIGGSYSDNEGDGVRFGSSGDVESGLSVLGAVIERNGTYGCRVRPTDNGTVANCTIRNNCRLSGNAEVSIQTDSSRGSAGTIVRGNRIHTTSTYAIDERDGTGPSLITANLVSGSYSTALRTAHPDTVVANNMVR